MCSDVNDPRECHTECSKSEKQYHILTLTYMESRKMVQTDLLAGKEQRCRCREWMRGHGGEGREVG